MTIYRPPTDERPHADCCCDQCFEDPSSDCQLLTLLRHHDSTMFGWHSFTVMCPGREDCEICGCDCDHCCFGFGKCCEDHGIVKSFLYPVDGSDSMKLIPKGRLSVTKQDVRYLDLMFGLAKEPEKNVKSLKQLATILPYAEYVSSDNGTRLTDIIEHHVKDKDRRANIYDQMLFWGDRNGRPRCVRPR
jgi:hypothetical protein